MYHDELMISTASAAPRFVRVIGRDSTPTHTRATGKSRDCAVIHYVLQGEGWFDGHKITAGHGFFFPSSEPHSYTADPDNPWYYVFMDVSQEFADWFVVPVIHADARGVFSFSFSEQLERWADRTFGQEHVTTVSTAEAIYHAMSILRRHSPVPDEHGNKQEFYVQQAKTYIEMNLNRRLSVTDVAKAVNLNERYLCSLFVKHEQVTTKDYMMQQKHQVAKHLLSDTNLSIKEVALSLGFADANCFTKDFKARADCSPSEYRNQIRNIP